ncbi:sensor histidine kinase [Caenispirillum bisanense]|uniref:histidine kinase n=1 Tax=Caenispirillum bisanense TaxID=414052 RepID=A0A286G904_9PROT|nr:HAMP domain-containing sensor histidine kinase [Caenispirillum bisanense]SOD91975.1 PAS fold-containing protein [Caenispirillum bisanense]
MIDTDIAAAIVDALPASGCLVDEHGIILAVSADWRRFGEENGSLDTAFGRGTNYVKLCAASADAAIRAIGRGVAQVLNGERDEFRHVYSCHAPWEVRWYRVSCRPVHADDRRLALVLHTSITSEVLKGSLLKEADREAARIGRERADLLQRLSDELRSPMNTIIGLADMLSQAVFGPLGNPRYEDYAREIGISGRRLRRLIDDVVELALMEAGELPLDESAVDVGAACEAVAAEIRTAAEEKRIDLLVWTPDTLPRLHADGERLREMLRHLVDNAIGVSPDGGRVTIEAAEDAAGCIAVTVTDLGPGLRRTDHGRLTEPFFKGGGPAVDPDHPGLGLALTKGLMDAHGGRLILRARPSRGTAVTLRFPNTRTLTGEA